MGILVFIPGLQGENTLSAIHASAVGTNEEALIDAVNATEWEYKKLNYQTSGNRNPTLAQMEATIESQLDEVISHANGSPVICVGSSVGFGVLIGALSRLKSTTSPIALIGFKPVPDPLMAIELQINNPQIVAAIKSGAIPKAPMPVESADGLKDTFLLSANHLNDPDATRILTSEGHVKKLNANVRSVDSCTLIYGAQDHLTPSAHMQEFASITSPNFPTDLIELQGSHATNFTKILSQEVSLLIARLG
jgi:hypothetical protein